MADFILRGAALRACSLVLGEDERRIDDEPEYYNHDPEQLRRMKDIFGFGARRQARPETTAGDMCALAARMVLEECGLRPAEIRAVISVTQTPDYPMPGNAHVLHAALGLGKDAAALDVPLGCSGFVHGLWLAAMTASAGGGPVLLTAGDTLGRLVHKKDRPTAPLFGDAGSAALIEPDPSASEMRFILRADGSRLRTLCIPAGGSRTPSGPETRAEIDRGGGVVRSDENFFMDGFGVFTFTMTEQPDLLRDILAFSGLGVEDVDYFILHQANKYIVDTITRKAGIPADKAPSDRFGRYGNQNSASIPGVLCGSLAEALKGRKVRAVMQGYGIGLSWGACALELDAVRCLEPAIYGGEHHAHTLSVP